MKRTRQGGFLTADLIVATSLLGLIIMVLTVSLVRFARFNHYQWARQRCTAAALAQLDCLTATASLIDAKELERLWPGVDVAVERTPAEAPWEGLDRVQVTAATKRTTVRLTRYVPAGPVQTAEGGQL
jgi:hypothetical protein